MLACMNGCIEMVECLIKHGAKVDACNSVGNTCLHLAAANNQVSVIVILLRPDFPKLLWGKGFCAEIYKSEQNQAVYCATVHKLRF